MSHSHCQNKQSHTRQPGLGVLSVHRRKPVHLLCARAQTIRYMQLMSYQGGRPNRTAVHRSACMRVRQSRIGLSSAIWHTRCRCVRAHKCAHVLGIGNSKRAEIPHSTHSVVSIWVSQTNSHGNECAFFIEPVCVCGFAIRTHILTDKFFDRAIIEQKSYANETKAKRHN